MSRESAIRRRDIVTYLEDRGIKIPPLAVLVPAIGIVLSEMSMYYGHLDYALWGHALTLLFCVLAPALTTSGAEVLGDVELLEVYALVPLFRLVNLGMPVFVELTIYWFPLVYAPLFPAIYVVVTGQEGLAIDTNPRAAARWLLPSIPIAVLLAEIEHTIITPEALIPEWSLTQLLIIAAVMFGFVGFVEELLFRGIFQRTLEDRLGHWQGLVLASALFGLMHSAYGTGWEILFAGVIGFVLGLIYDRTDSLLLVTFMHGLLNVFLFAVIPIHGSLLEIVV